MPLQKKDLIRLRLDGLFLLVLMSVMFAYFRYEVIQFYQGSQTKQWGNLQQFKEQMQTNG